jgi:hypothetical protein
MARIYYSTSSKDISAYTGNTNYNDKVSLTFTPNANKAYALFWNVVASGSSITNTNNVRFTKTSGTSVIYQQFDVTRDEVTEEHSYANVAIYTASASPSAETFAIQGRTSVITDSIYLSNAQITALELAADDVYTVATESVSTNNSTYSTTDSITVDAGDWYIFGSAGYNVDVFNTPSTGSMGIRISDGTTNYMEIDSWYSENVANWTPYWTIISVSPGTSTTYNLQYRDNTAGSTSLRYRTLLGLKKSGFYESFYTASLPLFTASVATQTMFSWVTTPTITGSYLVLESVMAQSPSEASVIAYYNFRKNGTSVFTPGAGELAFEGQSIWDKWSEGFSETQTLSGSTPITWSMVLRGTSGLNREFLQNASVLLLSLDSLETTNTNTTIIGSSIGGNFFRLSQQQLGSFVKGTQ